MSTTVKCEKVGERRWRQRVSDTSRVPTTARKSMQKLGSFHFPADSSAVTYSVSSADSASEAMSACKRILRCCSGHMHPVKFARGGRPINSPTHVAPVHVCDVLRPLLHLATDSGCEHCCLMTNVDSISFECHPSDVQCMH